MTQLWQGALTCLNASPKSVKTECLPVSEQACQSAMPTLLAPTNPQRVSGKSPEVKLLIVPCLA